LGERTAAIIGQIYAVDVQFAEPSINAERMMPQDLTDPSTFATA
jgi:hypothetical protein